MHNLPVHPAIFEAQCGICDCEWHNSKSLTVLQCIIAAGNLSFARLILQLFRLAFYLNHRCSSKCAICLLFESGFSKQRRHLAWPLAFPFSPLKLKNCVMPRVQVLQTFTKLMIVL